jgi:RNA polymerase subunit RPABC4/transcription elongation factor Spt4
MKKKSKSKEAKFFCESCGSEVPRNSKTCPVCGKFFASVRCPQCGRIGSNDDFKNGCPTCGYAVNPDDGFSRRGSAPIYGQYGSNSLLGLKKNKGSGKSGYVESSLPWWIYMISIMILLALVIGLYSCL